MVSKKSSEPTVDTGEFLVGMTDELEKFGPGSYIDEFVSNGFKNYNFKVSNGSGESRCAKCVASPLTTEIIISLISNH